MMGSRAVTEAGQRSDGGSASQLPPCGASWHAPSGGREEGYFLHQPACLRSDGPVLVSVHGISRNARAHATKLAPLAERYGAMVVAPLFDANRFPDYQRIGRRGARADHALLRVLDDVSLHTGANVERVLLFGYSGGAQFAHRFAMLHPERVRALGLGAAGWYTFPDPKLRFPLGMRRAPGISEPRIALARFLSLKIRVLVGDQDCERDDDLNRSARVDRQQGATRMERAASWTGSLRRAALALGVSSDIQLQVLPEGRHCFEQNVEHSNLDRRIFDGLLQTSPE